MSAEATTAAQPSESGDTPGWLPWALLALVVGAAVVFALWQRQKSRRRDENASFDAAVAEARWLEAEVLPTLLEAPRDERRGAWRVARPRVAALEAALGELAAPNTDSVVAVNAQHLKSAVTGVRGALDDETLSTGPENTGVAYGAAKQAARQLNQVLTRAPASGSSQSLGGVMPSTADAAPVPFTSDDYAARMAGSWPPPRGRARRRPRHARTGPGLAHRLPARPRSPSG